MIFVAARRLALLSLLAAASGCALTSKAEPYQVAYLRPASVSPGPEGKATPLELREVRAGDALGRTLLVARSPNVLAEVEGWRWTEEPARYVEQALGRALFESAAGRPLFRRALENDEVLRLEVHLLRFELDAEGQASLWLSATLQRGERVLFEERFTGRAPVGAAVRAAALEGEALEVEPGEALARGFTAALEQAGGQLRDRILAALEGR